MVGVGSRTAQKPRHLCLLPNNTEILLPEPAILLPLLELFALLLGSEEETNAKKTTPKKETVRKEETKTKTGRALKQVKRQCKPLLCVCNWMALIVITLVETNGTSIQTMHWVPDLVVKNGCERAMISYCEEVGVNPNRIQHTPERVQVVLHLASIVNLPQFNNKTKTKTTCIIFTVQIHRKKYQLSM